MSANLQKSSSKINNTPIPDFPQPSKFYPLPPLPFFPEAAQPIINLHHHKHFNHNQNHFQVEQKGKQPQSSEMEELKKKLNQIQEEYSREKVEHEYLKKVYKEGQVLFDQMQAKNHRLMKQIQLLKGKKAKVTFGQRLENKEVPVVKITVPNPKKLGNQSENEALYRQLKMSVEQINSLKKLLESEKQKSQFMVGELNRKLQKNQLEKDTLKNQSTALKEELKVAKEQNTKLKSGFQPKSQSKEGNVQFYYNEVMKLTDELESLRGRYLKAEKALSEKQTQIFQLRKKIPTEKHSTYEFQEQTAKKLFSFTESSHEVSKKQEKEIESLKSELLYKNILIENYEREKKQNEKQKLHNLEKGYQNELYERHLELSVKEMKSLEEYTKEIVGGLLKKIQNLKIQVQFSNKKSENMKKQLDKVYEILQTKKNQLQQCYRDIAQRTSNTSPTMGTEEARFKSLLKERRDYIPN